MKVNLAEIERLARAAKRNRTLGNRLMIRADDALEMVGRIRELEGGLRDALEIVEGLTVDRMVLDTDKEDAERFRKLLEKGTAAT